VRCQDAKQPSSLFFISTVRLSMRQKKKETKTQTSKCHILNKDKEEKRNLRVAKCDQ
jgi:hypothetical protein